MNTLEIGDLVELSEVGRHIKGTPWNYGDVAIVLETDRHAPFVKWLNSGKNQHIASHLLKKLKKNLTNETKRDTTLT